MNDFSNPLYDAFEEMLLVNANRLARLSNCNSSEPIMRDALSLLKLYRREEFKENGRKIPKPALLLHDVADIRPLFQEIEAFLKKRSAKATMANQATMAKEQFAPSASLSSAA